MRVPQSRERSPGRGWEGPRLDLIKVLLSGSSRLIRLTHTHTHTHTLTPEQLSTDQSLKESLAHPLQPCLRPLTSSPSEELLTVLPLHARCFYTCDFNHSFRRGGVIVPILQITKTRLRENQQSPRGTRQAERSVRPDGLSLEPGSARAGCAAQQSGPRRRLWPACVWRQLLPLPLTAVQSWTY